jgi:hypothetical protein
MKIRRTHDRDISFVQADPISLWTVGIIERKIDLRDRKFLMTPIMTQASQGSLAHRSASNMGNQTRRGPILRL